MKNFIANNWFKIVIAFTVLLAGFSVFYSFFWRPYQNDKPYRECVDRIDPNANFRDVSSIYRNCVQNFR